MKVESSINPLVNEHNEHNMETTPKVAEEGKGHKAGRCWRGDVTLLLLAPAVAHLQTDSPQPDRESHEAQKPTMNATGGLGSIGSPSAALHAGSMTHGQVIASPHTRRFPTTRLAGDQPTTATQGAPKSEAAKGLEAGLASAGGLGGAGDVALGGAGDMEGEGTAVEERSAAPPA